MHSTVVCWRRPPVLITVSRKRTDLPDGCVDLGVWMPSSVVVVVVVVVLVLVVEWTHTDRQTERQNRQTRPTDQPTPTPPRDARTLAGKHLAERLLELFHLGRHLLVAILSVWGSCFGGGQMVSVGVWIDKRLLVGAGVVVWGRGDVVVVASQGSSSLSVGVLIHNTINQPTPPSSTKVSTRTYMAVTASACLTGTMATWPGTRAATPLPEPAPVGVRWRRRACSPVVVGVVVVGWGGVGGGVTRREWGMVGQGGKGWRGPLVCGRESGE